MNTTLWYVGLKSGEKIVVSKKYQGQRHCIRIRSITANAAGRKFKKYNLPSIIIGGDEEWDNMFHPYNPPEDAEEVRRFRKNTKSKYYKRTLDRFKIEVIK